MICHQGFYSELRPDMRDAVERIEVVSGTLTVISQRGRMFVFRAGHRF